MNDYVSIVVCLGTKPVSAVRGSKKKGKQSATVRMLRSGSNRKPAEEEKETKSNDRKPPTLPTGLTKAFEGLSLKDFDSDDSDGEQIWPEIEESDESEESEETLENLDQRIRKWNKAIPEPRNISKTRARVQGYGGRFRPLPVLRKETRQLSPGGRPEEKRGHQRIQVGVSVPGRNENENSEYPNIVNEITYRQGNVEGSRMSIEERLTKVDFKKISKINTPYWREYCDTRSRNWKELIDDQEKKARTCTCYGFKQHCWVHSEQKWMVHIENCIECNKWSKKKMPS